MRKLSGEKACQLSAVVTRETGADPGPSGNVCEGVRCSREGPSSFLSDSCVPPSREHRRLLHDSTVGDIGSLSSDGLLWIFFLLLFLHLTCFCLNIFFLIVDV